MDGRLPSPTKWYKYTRGVYLAFENHVGNFSWAHLARLICAIGFRVVAVLLCRDSLDTEVL